MATLELWYGFDVCGFASSVTYAWVVIRLDWLSAVILPGFFIFSLEWVGMKTCIRDCLQFICKPERAAAGHP